MAQKFIVTGEQHYRITGQLLEIQRQIRMKMGSPIDPESVKRALQDIIEPGYGNKKGIGLYEFPFKLGTLEALRAPGYLDSSFEGKEVYRLVIRPLTKEQALDEFRKSGGTTWIRRELEGYVPYTIPKAETIDVMIMNFGRNIRSDEALTEMDKLGVRTLPPEWFIQYRTAGRGHQKKKWLISLTKFLLDGISSALFSKFDGDGRVLGDFGWDSVWDDGCYFPVVRK